MVPIVIIYRAVGEGRFANGAKFCPLVSVVKGDVGDICERASASRLKE